VIAAGDIACAPDDPYYFNGAGTNRYCRQMATSDAVLAQSPDAVLALGDTQYETATLSAYQTVYAPSWGRALAITRPAIGNHEYYTTGAAGYFDYFNGAGEMDGRAGRRDQGYYSFDLGGWHLVALNSNCSIVSCAAGSAQEQWLRDDLAAHPTVCTLAYFHHPRFTSINTTPETPEVTPLWQALYDHGADLILNGHAHSYERYARQDPSGTADPDHGIRQIVVGTGGKSLYPIGTRRGTSEVVDNTTLGVLRLTLDPGSYDWEFLPAVGTFTDAGQTACHGAPAA
jgi:hypothetical protein